jgi:tetratricopeptide (TPR) repeat protein
LKIELKSLPKEHKTFAETYKNIATAYEKRGQFDEAIEYAQKYVDQLKLHSLEASEELNDAIDLLKRNQRIRDIRK